LHLCCNLNPIEYPPNPGQANGGNLSPLNQVRILEQALAERAKHRGDHHRGHAKSPRPPVPRWLLLHCHHQSFRLARMSESPKSIKTTTTPSTPRWGTGIYGLAVVALARVLRVIQNARGLRINFVHPGNRNGSARCRLKTPPFAPAPAAAGVVDRFKAPAHGNDQSACCVLTGCVVAGRVAGCEAMRPMVLPLLSTTLPVSLTTKPITLPEPSTTFPLASATSPIACPL